MTHPLAGQPAPPDVLTDIPALLAAYSNQPDVSQPAQRVAFGTSGHRGSALNGSFNEAHILAITQAVCEYRKAQGITGPLFLGKDTHALSEPAQRSALEVLAANGVETRLQSDDGYTPTPVISRAILVHNRNPQAPRADDDAPHRHPQWLGLAVPDGDHHDGAVGVGSERGGHGTEDAVRQSGAALLAVHHDEIRGDAGLDHGLGQPLHLLAVHIMDIGSGDIGRQLNLAQVVVHYILDYAADLILRELLLVHEALDIA